MSLEVAKLLALLATAVVALGTSWLVTRPERRGRLPPALVEGYPSRDFARRELVEAVPLAGLCQSQSRLLALYRALPASSPGRAGLLVFLGELRAVMDGAYQLASLPASAEAEARLSRLGRDVRRAVLEMEERTHRHLNEASDELLQGELEVRLDVMRALARELDDV